MSDELDSLVNKTEQGEDARCEKCFCILSAEYIETGRSQILTLFCNNKECENYKQVVRRARI